MHVTAEAPASLPSVVRSFSAGGKQEEKIRRTRLRAPAGGPERVAPLEQQQPGARRGAQAVRRVGRQVCIVAGAELRAHARRLRLQPRRAIQHKGEAARRLRALSNSAGWSAEERQRSRARGLQTGCAAPSGDKGVPRRLRTWSMTARKGPAWAALMARPRLKRWRHAAAEHRSVHALTAHQQQRAQAGVFRGKGSGHPAACASCTLARP